MFRIVDPTLPRYGTDLIATTIYVYAVSGGKPPPNLRCIKREFQLVYLTLGNRNWQSLTVEVLSHMTRVSWTNSATNPAHWTMLDARR